MSSVARRVRAAGVALAAGLAAFAVLLAGAPGAARADSANHVDRVDQGSAQVTLRVALTTGIDTLNPFTAVKLASTQIGRLMYEFLTTYAVDGQTVAPGLAERWTHTPDGRTWTFAIRPGMTWSDGAPITARDAAFTYRLMMRDADAATANGSYTANFASVTATDDHTLVIKTRQPYASMLGLDIPIVPEHVWSGVTDVGGFTNEDTSRPVVGSGPFVLTRYRAGQVVTLRANDRYWRGRPRVDEVQFITYTNIDAAAQALRKGDVDIVSGLTVGQLTALSGQPGVRVNSGSSRRLSSLLINPGAAAKTGEPIGDGNPALTDVAVRQAIARALDLPTLVKRVWQGHAQVGASVIPPVFSAYHWEPGGGERHTFDPAAAGRLLDAAGYPRGPDGARRDRSGRKLALRLLAAGADPVQAQQAEHVRGWLADVGIEVTPRYESDTQVDEDLTGGRYDLALLRRSAGADPDRALALQTCAQRPGANGKGGATADFYCDAGYDRMYAQQAAELDRVRRAEIVKRMQAQLYRDAPEVVLAYPDTLEAYRGDRFGPFATQPPGHGVITGQNGYWWAYHARPAGAGAGGRGGPSATALVAVAGPALAVVALLGLAVARRRAARADERE
jgi:peptide/nickel transport system substrate-binding protein